MIYHKSVINPREVIIFSARKERANTVVRIAHASLSIIDNVAVAC